MEIANLVAACTDHPVFKRDRLMTRQGEPTLLLASSGCGPSGSLLRQFVINAVMENSWDIHEHSQPPLAVLAAKRENTTLTIHYTSPIAAASFHRTVNAHSILQAAPQAGIRDWQGRRYTGIGNWPIGDRMDWPKTCRAAPAPIVGLDSVARRNDNCMWSTISGNNGARDFRLAFAL